MDQPLKVQSHFYNQPPIPVPQAYTKGTYHPPLPLSRFYVPSITATTVSTNPSDPWSHVTLNGKKDVMMNVKYNNFMKSV
jgi:hypothetical protein